MKTNFLQYKGYYGSVNYDPENNILYGKAEFLKVLINYESKDIDTLKKAFQEAIDDYLAFCTSSNEEPEKPFKGGFNVRVGEERHRKAWVAAKYLNKNLNEYICFVLDESFERINPDIFQNYSIAEVNPNSEHDQGVKILKDNTKCNPPLIPSRSPTPNEEKRTFVAKGKKLTKK